MDRTWGWPIVIAYWVLVEEYVSGDELERLVVVGILGSCSGTGIWRRIEHGGD